MLVMVLGLFATTRGQFSLSRNYSGQTACLYVAEAAIADAIQELRQNAGWNAGFNGKPMQNSPGQYWVTFNTTGPPYSNLQSVNNMGNSAAAANYRSPTGVPARSVSLVVRARVGTTERVVEVILCRGGDLELNHAMLAEQGIAMQGDVLIDGIAGLSDATRVNANVHTNVSGALANTVTWSGLPTESALVDGRVTSTSTNPSAINMGAAVLGGSQYGVPPARFPSVDIPGTISSKSAAPAPAINMGGATLLPSGDYYVAGNLTVPGDLELNGANLYVNGDLTVVGSISGDGSVFVQDETTFSGDANITGLPDQGIALFSEGSVTLNGFDGNNYLSTLAATDPVLAADWANAQAVLADFDAHFKANTIATLGSGVDPARVTRVEMQKALTNFGGAPGHLGQSNLAGKLASQIALKPAGPTRDFMVKKFTWVSDMFKGGGTHYGGDSNAITQWQLTGNPGALLDSVADMNRVDLWGSVSTIYTRIGFDRLGTSYFQGAVYTNGDFTASNELVIVGGLMVRGGVSLNNGIQLTYVRDMFEPGGVFSNGGPIGVAAWMSR